MVGIVVRGTVGLVVCAACMAPAHATASDFWAEVRTPGLHTWRVEVKHARTALRARQWSTALQSANKAVAALGGRAEGHLLRGRALGELGRGGEALRAIERALELEPRVVRRPETGAHAAKLAAELRAYPLAARLLEAVLGTMSPTPRRNMLYTLYGDVLLARGASHLQDSIQAYHQAVRDAEGRTYVRASLGLALALSRHGERARAHDRARAAVAHGRVDAVVDPLALPAAEKAARRAVARAAIGDEEGARRAWRAALDSEPWRDHARAELARLDEQPRRARGFQLTPRRHP